MTGTPQRRSATAADPAQAFDPTPPQQPETWPPASDISGAMMQVSNALRGLTTDSENPFYKSAFLSLPGLYASLWEPMQANALTISSAVVFNAVAGIFVIRTTVVHVPTSQSRSSDFPIGRIEKKEDIGSFMTYGTRYNIFALFSFYPEKDTESDSAPSGQTGYNQTPVNAPWLAPQGQQPSAQQPAQPPYGQPPQQANYGPPPAQAGYGQPYQQPAWGGPPPQAGNQRTDPSAFPALPPNQAPPVLA